MIKVTLSSNIIKFFYQNVEHLLNCVGPLEITMSEIDLTIVVQPEHNIKAYEINSFKINDFKINTFYRRKSCSKSGVIIFL